MEMEPSQPLEELRQKKMNLQLYLLTQLRILLEHDQYQAAENVTRCSTEILILEVVSSFLGPKPSHWMLDQVLTRY